MKFKLKCCLSCKNEFTPTSGVQKYCITCKDKHYLDYHKDWYWRNLENCRKSKRKWNNSSGVKYRKKWYAENKEIVNTRLTANYLERTRSRIKANRIVSNLGWKRECNSCESLEKINIHHIDQNPFNNDITNLILLCRVCHTDLHCRIRMERDQSHVPSQTLPSSA